MSTTNSNLRPSQPPPAASSSTTTTTSASAPTTTLAKPPTDIHPTAHLDPAAYVLGTHPISVAPQVLIHPRARLISTHGPLIIDTGTIISERCIVGGPAPVPAPILDPSTANPAPGPLLTAGDADDDDADDDLPLKTTLGSSVLLHPSCTIHAGATLQAACIIEPHATVLPSVTIGSHAKVCAGVTVDRDVADWEVVLGDGKQRRKRTPDLVYEDVRLRALERDREGTMGLLREAAKKALTLGKQRKN